MGGHEKDCWVCFFSWEQTQEREAIRFNWLKPFPRPRPTCRLAPVNDFVEITRGGISGVVTGLVCLAREGLFLLGRNKEVWYICFRLLTLPKYLRVPWPFDFHCSPSFLAFVSSLLPLLVVFFLPLLLFAVTVQGEMLVLPLSVAVKISLILLSVSV
jgi:hypothetical protein